MQRLYLRGGGRANSAAGDGGLSATAPGDEPPDHYVYNPRDPVPTVGGCTLLPSPLIGVRSGPRDQRAIEARGDVLVYTSEPLERGHRGRPARCACTLFAASSAPDTDWTAKLVDVHPDGRANGIADGILRARYRDGLERPELLEPDAADALRGRRWARPACCSAPGTASGCRSRARTSRASRATRTPAATSPRRRRPICGPRCQTVFHDAERASYLELPIVPPRA